MNINDIKRIRDITGISIDAIRQALLKADGKIEDALNILKESGAMVSVKKSARETGEGLIFSYVHSTGKIGVLLKLFCETDFVARNDQFKNLGHELAMHIAAMSPQNIEELLAQSYIRDQDFTVADLVKSYISKLGENIRVGGFYRLSL